MCVSERIVRCMEAREIETNVMSDDTHAYTHTYIRARNHTNTCMHSNPERQKKIII